MTKFNKAQFNAAKQGTPVAIQTAPVATGRTHNSAPGYARDAKSELFLLAVGNFYGEDTFYTTGDANADRLRNLVHQVAGEDHEWLGRFLPWLRNVANMRTASIVAALETARAMAKQGIPGGRAIVAASMSRADEPGEALAYWSGTYGTNLPKPVKRGIADAATRLYTQHATLKYDTDSKGYRFGDVLELTHAAPETPEQSALFKLLLERAHHRANIEVPDVLQMICANRNLRAAAARNIDLLLNETQLRLAGMNWEDALSLAGKRLDKAALWTAMIPTMGYMALLRNLRNFDEAGIKGDIVNTVVARLSDPAAVAKSRQLPMRFLSAYRELASNNYSLALERALDASLANVPKLEGRTLVLIDTSGSMHAALSAKSKLMRWDAAVIFGLAVAKANTMVDVVSFSNDSRVFVAKPGESLLRSIDRWKQGGYFYGGGTSTEKAVRTHYRNHDTVVILTDEQADYHSYGNVAAAVPADKTVITFNLAGERMGHAASGTPRRVTIGGMSDAAFKLLPALSTRAQGGWPF